MPNVDRQNKLDVLLGRALRDKEFREKLIADPAEVAKEVGLSADELQLVAGGLAIGSAHDPRRVMWCTEKTCNEKGGARVVMFSPDPTFRPFQQTLEAPEAPGKAEGPG